MLIYTYHTTQKLFYFSRQLDGLSELTVFLLWTACSSIVLSRSGKGVQCMCFARHVHVSHTAAPYFYTD